MSKRIKMFVCVLLIPVLLICIAGCSKQSNVKDDDYVFSLLEDESGYVLDYYSGFSDKTINIPSSYKDKPVLKIGENAFSYSLAIEIIVPNSIKYVESGAISGCRARYIILGNGIEEIEDGAFWGNYFIRVEVNNKYTFENVNLDTGLGKSKTIKVPKSVADNATNDYLNNTDNFTKTTDGDYYIYTRVNN